MNAASALAIPGRQPKPGALTGLARRLGRIAAGNADQPRILLDRRRFADEVSLHPEAIGLAQKVELLLGLDAFGHDRNVETKAEPDHRTDDRRRLRVAAEVHHKGPVDLDLV